MARTVIWEIEKKLPAPEGEMRWQSLLFSSRDKARIWLDKWLREGATVSGPTKRIVN